MQTGAEKYILNAKLNKDIFRKRFFVAMLISIIVIIGVFWWLKIIGITMAGEAFCGLDEHVHDEECSLKVLICTEAECEAHVHGDECYQDDLICLMAEQEAHFHGDECYLNSMTCTLEEREAHFHGTECYQNDLICGMDGLEDHVHSDSCYQSSLICTIVEGEGHIHGIECYQNDLICIMAEQEGHIHGDECYLRNQICFLEETEGHIHEDACYEISCLLGLEEHIHTDICYSDITADLESPVYWEQTMAHVVKTNILSENLVNIARSQLGYAESTRNFIIGDDEARHGYTRYGEWYGNPYGNWSTMFVSFCMSYSGIPADAVPYLSGAETMRINWEEMGMYATVGTYYPTLGDMVFMDTDFNGTTDKVGIVSGISGVGFTAIVGDYNDSVCEIFLSPDDLSVIGYGTTNDLAYLMLDFDTQLRINNLIAEIDALPDMQTVAATLMSYEDNEDYESYEVYFTDISSRSHTLYVDWEDLDLSLRPLVTNNAKLLEFSPLWARTLEVLQDVTIYQVNTYKVVNNTLVRGNGTVKDNSGTDMSFKYWNAYVVSKNENGYYVSRIVTDTVVKNDIAIPSGGFVILLNNNTWNVSVGDIVSTTFAFQNVSGYNSGGYGTVKKGYYFTESDNALIPIVSADTSELIEVNLFNYGSDINDLYYSNPNLYPGFQQDTGTTSTSTTNGFSYGSFNFGNNITVDRAAGGSGITEADKLGQTPQHHINSTAIDANGNAANRPVQGAMNYNLVNGYPMLANGVSLDWLFTNNASTSTTKINSKNINGLFLQDPVTGKYYFDCRLNHAEYNSSTGNFDLYSQRLTPNYMMYPFGNFMPFASINRETTAVTTINRDYFLNVANRAAYKSTTLGSDYSTLSRAVNAFVTKMDNTYGTSWNYQNAADKYFEAVVKVPTGGGSGGSNPFADMYNIDYDEPKDFFFGMTMHMNFIMPKDGLTGPDGQQPMEFDFNGDDDVWIYVDNKLFLDLSGIHRHVGGRIDFSNGRVEYYEFNKETGEADLSIQTGHAYEQSYIKMVNGVPKTIYYIPFSVFLGDTAATLINPETGTFYDYTNHTIDFYYMERGSGSSICKMEFNMPLLQKNSISVTKEMTSDDNLDVLGNPDFKFVILKEDGATPLIGAGVQYTINDANTQNTVGTGITGENGVFTLKAGQTAVFPGVDENSGRYFVRELLDPTAFEQYGTVTVDGHTETTDHYTHVTVGTDSFKGVDSAVKDISDGNTSFLFTNHVDINKYGNLRLQKIYNDYQSDLSSKPVTFEFYLDGVPIPVGTAYTVIRPDGIYETRYITQAGLLSFSSDEAIYFPKILAGTSVWIRETAESSEGYAVSYVAQGDFNFTTGTDPGGVYGSGLIPSGSTGITVYNDREGTKLTLPVTKTLLYPDGTEHSYSLAIQQIVSITDPTPDGVYIRAPITLTSGSVDTYFTLNFPPGTPDGSYYYLVYEEGATSTNGMDTTKYIVEITTASEDGKVSVTSTNYYSFDGTPISDPNPLKFTNRIVRPLTVTKTVQGIYAPDEPFTFTVNAAVSGTSLNGSYTLETAEGLFTVEFVDGVATLLIEGGETVTIHDLPYGTEWTVTEAPAYGFYTKYFTESTGLTVGNSASGTLADANRVDFYNIGGYELPSTGSAGSMICIFAGGALMLLSLICAFILRRRSERRQI